MTHDGKDVWEAIDAVERRQALRVGFREFSASGHDLDPFTLKCWRCGMTKREIVLDRVFCPGFFGASS